MYSYPGVSWLHSCCLVHLNSGHVKEVVDLAACAARPGLLASLARDGNVRVWDAPSGACLASHTSDASCLVRALTRMTPPHRQMPGLA